MSDTPRKRAEIVSDFNDAGTGERFTKGDTPLIDAGAFGNYEAAGLVRAHTPETKAPAKAKTATRRPSRAAPAAPATPPAPESPAPEIRPDE